MDVWERRPDGTEASRQLTFLVQQSLDDVAVSFPDQAAVPSMDFRGAPFPAQNREPVARASVSLSAGARLYDRAGAVVEQPDIPRLRIRPGLSSESHRQLSRPNSGPGGGGSRRYVTRLITPDRSARQLQALRSRAGPEERMGPGQVRFTRVEGNVTDS